MYKNVDKMKYLSAVQFNKIEVAILESCNTLSLFQFLGLVELDLFDCFKII